MYPHTYTHTYRHTYISKTHTYTYIRYTYKHTQPPYIYAHIDTLYIHADIHKRTHIAPHWRGIAIAHAPIYASYSTADVQMPSARPLAAACQHGADLCHRSPTVECEQPPLAIVARERRHVDSLAVMTHSRGACAAHPPLVIRPLFRACDRGRQQPTGVQYTHPRVCDRPCFPVAAGRALPAARRRHLMPPCRASIATMAPGSSLPAATHT